MNKSFLTPLTASIDFFVSKINSPVFTVASDSNNVHYFRHSKSYWLLLILVYAILIAPFWLVNYLPLIDYPAHIARAYIVSIYEQSAFYQTHYQPFVYHVPNSAIEWLIPGLLKIFSVLTASKILLSGIVLLYITGCHLLGTLWQGKNPWFVLPSAFVLYNSMLLGGTVNYLCSLGLFLITLAFWLRWRASLRIWQFLLLAVLVYLAFIAHLSSYVFFGICIALIIVWNWWQGRWSTRFFILSGFILLPEFLTFLLFMRGNGRVGSIGWSTVAKKLSVWRHLFVTYDKSFDVAWTLTLIFIVALTVLLIRKIQFVQPALLPGIVFALGYVFCPEVLFTSWGADLRFVTPALVFLLLSLKPTFKAQFAKPLLLAFVALYAVRIGFITYNWQNIDRRVTAEVERLNVIPNNSKVLSFYGEKYDFTDTLCHIVMYAAINREAFIPTTYTIPGQQPLLVRDQTFWQRPFIPAQLSAEYFSSYDYIWVYFPAGKLRGYLQDKKSLEAQLQPRCTMLYEQDEFSLWKIQKDNQTMR